MPDPTRRRLLRLDARPAREPTAEEREAFGKAVEEPIGETRPPEPPPVPPSPHELLRALQRGASRIREESEISVRQLTREVARTRLRAFLRERQAAGDRFVKVIHGKGHRSRDGCAVLPKRVPEWLAAWKPGLVAGFGPARRDDGGSGALYVILAPRNLEFDP